MMVNEGLNGEEVDGNNDAMDFECELYSGLKSIVELV